MRYRPWGELKWLTSKLPIESYSLLGCVSTEIRCSAVISDLKSQNKLHLAKFIEIIDPNNSSVHDQLRKESRDRILEINHSTIVETHKLLEPTERIIKSFEAFISQCNGNVVLDISAFPKRFFFPLTKLLFQNDSVENLLVTYTGPERYAPGSLSENAQSWAPIPLFIPDDIDEKKIDLAIIGIGFMPLGLPYFLKDKQQEFEIKFLFPFPPGSPYYQRTWDFVSQIDAVTKIDTKQIYRLDSAAMPLVFDKIEALAQNRQVIFAPYGPKTFSMAMCLYSILNNCAVYYTQPTSYNPKYSEGCGETLAYLLKLNKKPLYS